MGKTAYNFIDLTGVKFGKLTVISRGVNNKYNRATWECKCDCGNFVNIVGNSLNRGVSKSCGCYKSQYALEANTTHGMSKTKIYSVWCSMIERCGNPNNKSYKDYGGRGVIICDKWLHSFENFYNDMNDGYIEGLSLDRKNVNGNYEISNCKWSTQKEQANNKRNNRIITYNNETLTMAQWARKIGIDYPVLQRRINHYKWTIEKALTTGTRK